MLGARAIGGAVTSLVSIRIVTQGQMRGGDGTHAIVNDLSCRLLVYFLDRATDVHEATGT